MIPVQPVHLLDQLSIFLALASMLLSPVLDHTTDISSTPEPRSGGEGSTLTVPFWPGYTASPLAIHSPAILLVMGSSMSKKDFVALSLTSSTDQNSPLPLFHRSAIESAGSIGVRDAPDVAHVGTRVELFV